VAARLVVDVLACRGDARQVGRGVGAAWRRQRGQRVRRPPGRQPIPRLDLADARRTLEAHAPHLWEELQGLAEGLERPLAETVAAFSNGRLAYPRHGCSAAIGGGLYGRNYDYDPRRYDRVLAAVQVDGAAASIGFAERLVGRLDGMNEHGLAVGLHRVGEAGAQPGLVPGLIVRILLDTCAGTAEAVERLRRLPHGLAYNYSLLDRSGEAAVVEAAPGAVAVRRGAALACTNHFQSPQMPPAGGPARGSRRRLAPLEAWARAGLDAAGLFAALNAGGSPAFHHGYADGFGTLHTLVAEPAARRLTVGIGADAAPCVFDVAAWAAGDAPGVERLAGTLGDLGPRQFFDRNLAGAEFRNVSLAGARFDDIDFAGAEIGPNCNFRGMRLAGIAVEDLFTAWRRQKGSGGA